MTHGIEISLSQLSSVEVAEDGKTAKFGGGTISKTVTDELWKVDKQAGKSTVSYIQSSLSRVLTFSKQ